MDYLMISGEIEVINSLNNRREIGDDPLDQKAVVEILLKRKGIGILCHTCLAL